MTGIDILGMLVGIGMAAGMIAYFIHVWRHPQQF